NDLATAHYRTETWDPATGHWTRGATHVRARMYHSVAMLLPDATIVTGAGGSPGPQTNPNTEIYYPPYLFKKDGSGDFAPRPVIEAAPSSALSWNQPFHVKVSAGTSVSRVTLLRTGAITHAFNPNQQLIEMPFAQDGQRVELVTPALAVDAPPGFYLLFVFDQAGVPSVARFLRLMDTGTGIPPPPPPNPSKQLIVYDGQSIGYSPWFGDATACDHCKANVKAPVVTGTAGQTSVRLRLPPVGGITAVSFHGTSTLPVGQYRALRFSVFPTQTDLRFRVALATEGADGTASGPEAGFVVKGLAASQWNSVSIPMSAFASATQFNRVKIEPAGPAGTETFYLDNLVALPSL
ncbi:MAG TPA: galactose oxidase early set domain-containing protein, partial [Candidatus Limnocylindria bacterium]|nr:galactose oxidase early set domain-containing protein [Candidatus Limnocylindria bacterium]